MIHSFLNDIDAGIIVLILFFSMLIAVGTGYRIGLRKTKSDNKNAEISSSLLGLLALILGFTFAMAGSRYENRKDNLIDEANCIGTAVLRSDIYPDSIKVEFQKDFQSYLKSRKEYYLLDNDEAKLAASLKEAALAGDKLWKRAAFYAKDKDYFIQSNMMLPALNQMLDSAAKSNMVLNSKVPETIVYLSLIFSVIISFFMGYNSGLEKKINRKYIFGFCFLICVVIYITLDLDRPRRGLIKLDTELALMQQLNQN
ncbi:hypothetical protein [Flavobacterium nackdongense]|uniref:DUF4239 domain-containing protein n=1 Tax=Flavobacterium nackdongense TaxID=2547394 RepID=A0A4P6Y8M0_9FLAO|nr:hypothetical protein [Flavobacterium nackdongense]QBN19221.1 hypothetical protein E1750_10540 [Flavobacterium nackdongense]